MTSSVRRGIGIGLLFLCACGATEEPAPPPVQPADHDGEAYARDMSEVLGVPFSSADLALAAAGARERIVTRMNQLADKIEPGSNWQAVFSNLKLEHPPDVEGVLAAYREELAAAREFVLDRHLATGPSSGPEVVELGNLALRQNYPLAIYLKGRLGITTTDGREPDPGYLVNHCDVCIPPLAVHEGYPGHHLAFTRLEENHADGDPRDIPRNREPRPTLSTAGLDAFWVEGWGLYAELLMLEQGYYTEAARELGAWRMLLLRIVRAEVDARLHSGEITAEEAAEIYRDELQMSPAAAATEVRRHVSAPKTKATYFIGMLQLLELRRRVLAENPELTLEGFHDRILEEAGPIAEIARDRFGIELGSPGIDELSGSELLASGS